MKITRKAAVIVRGDEILCASGFVPIQRLSTRNRIRVYESVSRAESALKQSWFIGEVFDGAKAIEVIEQIGIPGGMSW